MRVYVVYFDQHLGAAHGVFCAKKQINNVKVVNLEHKNEFFE